MKILIVAKTKMSKGRVCIGGIDVETNQLVRLMNPGGNSIPETTNFQVGQIWEVDCTKRQNITPPHIEDIIIGRRKLISSGNDISDYVNDNEINVWEGGVKRIFDGKLGWTGNGSGYIGGNNLPSNSVGFWRTDQDLIYNGKGKYIYKRKGVFSSDKVLSYKGHEEPLSVIPKGTLVRVSLARWWHPTDIEIEDRCYLQLSGWY